MAYITPPEAIWLKWHNAAKVSPAQPGWYPCTILCFAAYRTASIILRWWDGKCWSQESCLALENREEVSQQMRERGCYTLSEDKLSKYSWTEPWW